jgi:hypothetical protein
MLLGGVIDKDATVVEAEVELVELAELTIAVAREGGVSGCHVCACATTSSSETLPAIFGSGPRRS